jgi:N-acetylmuramoyl-L-alanine amidase
MNVRFLISVLAILLFGACAQQERKVTPFYRETVPPIQESTPSVAPVQPAPTTPPPVVEVKPEPKPVVTTPPPTNQPTATPPLAAWISLQNWCAQNKLSPPLITREEGETNITVSIRSDNGVFTFDYPRRNAHWNGVLLGVGFAPVFTNHVTLVNAIDVSKVLQPLLLTNETPRQKGGVIVIDAGHGGSNDGAISRDKKLKEKNLTLDWARRVQRLLQGSDWQVYMTRTNDASLSLTQRVAFAEAKKADIFISLHFNSFSKTSEAGLETYCMTPVGMASHVTREFADDINIAVPNNEFDIDNFLLAYDLHRAMLRKTGSKDRGVRRARFMTVLRDQRRPAVLLEGGYLSNPEEAKLIATPEYRQKLAEAVVEALGVNLPTLTTLRE